MDLASSLGNFHGMVANYFPSKEIRSQTILTQLGISLVNELDRTFGGLISSKLCPKWLARLRLWDRALMARPFNRIFPIGAGITQGTSANAKRVVFKGNEQEMS